MLHFESESEGSLEAEFPLSGDLSFFILRLSSDWMMPIDIMEGNLHYFKSTDLNVNLMFKKCFFSKV